LFGVLHSWRTEYEKLKAEHYRLETKYRQLEAEYHRLGPLAIKVAEERKSLENRVRELEQDLETITRHRDSLKTEIVYLGWDLETAQQLHKIAEHKLEQASIG
jgi:chromosome segregation ATPase